jgi:hypothetical protein
VHVICGRLGHGALLEWFASIVFPPAKNAIAAPGVRTGESITVLITLRRDEYVAEADSY